MAFEIVDGMTGTKHISSDDLSALNIATIGKADCVLKYGDDFKLTMASANSATLGTGVGMVGGKRFWNQAATSLTVQSGTQGQKRNDLVVARYAKTGAGVESITPVVIKGTPSTGTAADPATTSNDLKLWRIPLDGINAADPEPLFSVLTPLATIGESVSPAQGVLNPANGWSKRSGKVMRVGDCVTMWLDVSAGTGANMRPDATFATMPAEFAPREQDLEFPVLGFTTTSYPVSFWVRITTKGEIKIKQYVLPQNTVLGQIKSCCTYLRI